MVATILKLRARTTLHSLRREWWRLLVIFAGAVWSLSLIPAVAWASRILSFNAPDLKYDAIVAVVTVLAIGWLIVPIFVTGMDDTLDPSRFATFGTEPSRIVPGLTISAVLTLPSLFFLAVAVIVAYSWRPEGTGVATIAVIGAVLTWATWVMSGRVTVMWAMRLLRSSYARQVILVAFGVGAALIAPVIYLVVVDGRDVVLEYDLRLALQSLGYTPIGAPVHAAYAATRGDFLASAGYLAMAAAWLALLVAAWAVNVSHRLVNPVARGAGVRQREDAIWAAADAQESRGKVSGAERARRAVTSRLARAWRSDPRYLVSLVSATVFPVLFFVLVYPIFGSPRAIALAVPLVLAGSIGWGRYNDVALDNSALWLDVVSGKRGRQVMRGRTLATVAWGLPAALTMAIVAVAVTGEWPLLPGVVGATVGVLGTTLAVSAVTSVALTHRAPAAGENPFAAEMGSVGAALAAQVVSSLASWLVAVPVAAPLFLALRFDTAWAWAWAWAWVGVVTGPAVAWVMLTGCLTWAGRLYDTRSGRLISAVT